MEITVDIDPNDPRRLIVSCDGKVVSLVVGLDRVEITDSTTGYVTRIIAGNQTIQGRSVSIQADAPIIVTTQE